MPYRDKEQQRKYQKQHFANNKARYNKSLRDNRQKKLEFVRQYKTGKCCHHCGLTDTDVLEFHHTDPSLKIREICELCRRSVKLDIIKEEIEKCDLLCRNCHRLTYKQSCDRTSTNKKGKEIHDTRDKVSEYKGNIGCLQCGIKDHRVLDFHHRNPSDKFKGISKMVRQHYSFKTILLEIEKCDVLCANCHIKLHKKFNA